MNDSTVTRTSIDRSLVDIKTNYGDYREILRYDFIYSCAYCTLIEVEATGIHFVIDHYHPRSERPDLLNEYSNLMYCCNPCNIRKGDRNLSEEAQSKGLRFFRPDIDSYDTHFSTLSGKISGKSITGDYTIQYLDLNRSTLIRIRDMRERLYNCSKLVAEGMFGLRNFSLDQLPVGMRSNAIKSISKAEIISKDMALVIDDILRDFAKSSLIDPEIGPEYVLRQQERKSSQKKLQGLFPGAWQQPATKKKYSR